MQIGLWLTAASLYRELALLEEARQAIAEAELIAEALVKMDELVRKGNSRIFHGDYNVMAAMQERHWTGKNSGKLSSHKMLKRGTSTGQVDEAISTSRWGMVEAPLRRILSDISFEVRRQRAKGRKRKKRSSKKCYTPLNSHPVEQYD